MNMVKIYFSFSARCGYDFSSNFCISKEYIIYSKTSFITFLSVFSTIHNGTCSYSCCYVVVVQRPKILKGECDKIKSCRVFYDDTESI